MVVLMLAFAGIAHAHTTPVKSHLPAIKLTCPEYEDILTNSAPALVIDTNKTKHNHQNRMDVLSPGVIKEIPRAKRQPKPEKIVTVNTTTAPADTTNKKQRSKRRPEGMERPPDIIRRNNN